jgi:hypothetical protein
MRDINRSGKDAKRQSGKGIRSVARMQRGRVAKFKKQKMQNAEGYEEVTKLKKEEVANFNKIEKSYGRETEGQDL